MLAFKLRTLSYNLAEDDDLPPPITGQKNIDSVPFRPMSIDDIDPLPMNDLKVIYLNQQHRLEFSIIDRGISLGPSVPEIRQNRYSRELCDISSRLHVYMRAAEVVLFTYSDFLHFIEQKFKMGVVDHRTLKEMNDLLTRLDDRQRLLHYPTMNDVFLHALGIQEIRT